MPSYVPNPNALRYARNLTTSNVTRPIRLVSGHNIRKRTIARNAIHWTGHIASDDDNKSSTKRLYLRIDPSIPEAFGFAGLVILGEMILDIPRNYQSSVRQ